MTKITNFLLATALVASTSVLSVAQKILDAKDAVKEMTADDKAKTGWTRVGGLGASFNALSLINPRAGAGDNSVGFGGLLNYSANLKRGKLLWDNRIGFQLASNKIAGNDWAKAADVLQGTSQIGYLISGKWYAAGLADLQTQILPTYGTNALKASVSNLLTGKFFAPAIFRLAPGVIYRANDNFKVLFSPVAYKGVYVLSDSVAKRGNWLPVGVRTDHQVGAEVRADYTRKFWDGKLVYTGTLDLYTNYRKNFGNIDVEFYNSLDLTIWKNISINFKTDWFYDDDILVQVKTDAAQKPVYGKDVFFRNALFVKYNTIF